MMFWPIKEFQKWTVLFSKASYLSGVLGAKQLVVLNTQVTLSRCSANSSLTLSTSVTKLEEVIFRHRKTKHPLENNSRRNFSFGRLRPFWQRSGLYYLSPSYKGSTTISSQPAVWGALIHVFWSIRGQITTLVERGDGRNKSIIYPL